jgi:hypothetical protein
MSSKAMLMMVNGHADNAKASNALAEAGVEFDSYSVPPSVAEWVRVPYIKSAAGELFYGLNDIKFYIELRRRRFPTPKNLQPVYQEKE